MLPISNKDRERIILHKKNKETNADISKWLCISVSTITRIWALYKSTGKYKPRPQNSGRKPRVTPDDIAAVVAQIKQTPDITLLELIEKFQLPLSESALCKRLIKLGYTYKKRCSIQMLKKEQTW